MANILKYKEASLKTGLSVWLLKEEFGNVLEALKDCGYLRDDTKIPVDFIDAYLYGSPLFNQEHILDRLEAREFLVDELHLSPREADGVIQGNAPIDYWVFIKALASYQLGKPLPTEFRKYVELPLQRMLEEEKSRIGEAKKEYNKVIKKFKKIAEFVDKEKKSIKYDKDKLIKGYGPLAYEIESIERKLDEMIEFLDRFQEQPLAAG